MPGPQAGVTGVHEFAQSLARFLEIRSACFAQVSKTPAGWGSAGTPRSWSHTTLEVARREPTLVNHQRRISMRINRHHITAILATGAAAVAIAAAPTASPTLAGTILRRRRRRDRMPVARQRPDLRLPSARRYRSLWRLRPCTWRLRLWRRLPWRRRRLPWRRRRPSVADTRLAWHTTSHDPHQQKEMT